MLEIPHFMIPRSNALCGMVCLGRFILTRSTILVTVAVAILMCLPRCCYSRWVDGGSGLALVRIVAALLFIRSSKPGG